MINLRNHGLTRWSQYGFTLFFACGLLISMTVAYASPRTPVNDTEVLAKFPTQTSKVMQSLRNRLKHSPDDSTLASQLAKRYIQKARADSDSRYYGYAKAVLKPWREQQNPPAEVLFPRATLRQHQHQFSAAITDLKQLLKRQPRHTQAWLALSIIQQIQGDYSAARASCSALARLASSWLSSLCHSQILSLTGSAERAFKLQQALALQAGSSQPEVLQWVLVLSAQTAVRQGNKKQADQQFKKALSIPIRDAFLLRVYSDYLLAEDQPEKVLELLKGEIKDDALLLRLAMAAKQAHKVELKERYTALLARRYKAATLRGSQLHEKDEALYLLEFGNDEDEKRKAILLARENWQIQREPEDALVLLRAAVVNKSNNDIQVIRDWIDKHQLQDVRLTALLDRSQDDS